MSIHRAGLRPLIIPDRKNVSFDAPPNLTGGHLSPDLQPNTPPTFPQTGPSAHHGSASQIGEYILLDPIDSNGPVQTYKSLHTVTHQEFTCKVMPLEEYRDRLSAYWRVGYHDNLNQIEEILLGDTQAYVFFSRNYGDLHSYVRAKRRLKEAETLRLFRQIAAAVLHCHDNGIVLRGLKLRMFVFKDAEKTELKLEGLEDACVLDDDDNDRMCDKHGCPAYVSPEILQVNAPYSGKAADIWSLGVILYTMLIGRYPFHDVEPSALFGKIRRGQYSVPDTVSSRAKCLIRSMLRRAPEERLSAQEVLEHPWLRGGILASSSGSKHHSKDSSRDNDHVVPQVELFNEESLFS